MNNDDTPRLAVRVTTTGLCALFVATSVALFISSLSHEGFYTDRAGTPGSSGSGAGLLALGWVMLLQGFVAWFANPAVFFSWVAIWFRSNRPAALICAISALCLSLSFMLRNDYPMGAVMERITGYGDGYWLWNASIATMVLGTLIVSLFTKWTSPCHTEAASAPRD